MDGMILAAGLGTRLRPITDDIPKALVEVGGKTLLERTVQRLAEAGCDRIVVNLHHHGERIEGFLAAVCSGGPQVSEEPGDSFAWHGADILVSREPVRPLDTGGALKQASPLFRGDRTILVHNVDVLSSVDLADLARRHDASGALATLAVNRRDTRRYLVFDGAGLCGRVNERTGVQEWAREPREPTLRAGFTGIHVLDPGILAQLTEEGAFSIMSAYVRLAAGGARVLPVDVTGESWIDVGTPDRLAAANETWGRSS